jgi:hypothetical protein
MKKNFFLSFFVLFLISLFPSAFAQSGSIKNPVIDYKITEVTASYSAKPTDTAIKWTNTGAIRTLTLYPNTAFSTKGRVLKVIAASDAGTYNLTINNSANSLLKTCSKGSGTIEFINSGTTWNILNDNCTPTATDSLAVHLAGTETITGNKTLSGTVTMSNATVKLTGKTQSRQASFVLSATATTGVFSLPVACRITAIKIIPSASLSASDTDKYAFAFSNTAATKTLVDGTAAANTTAATGGSALTAGTARSLTLNADTTKLQLTANEVVNTTITKSGTPAANNLLIIMEYIEE